MVELVKANKLHALEVTKFEMTGTMGPSVKKLVRDELTARKASEDNDRAQDEFDEVKTEPTLPTHLKRHDAPWNF